MVKKGRNSLLTNTPVGYHGSDGTVRFNKKLVKERSVKEMENFKKEISIDDHLITMKALLKRYDTSLTEGLPAEKAELLLLLNGPNCLVPSKSKSRWVILATYMFGGFSILLWIGAILSGTGFVIDYMRDPNAPYDQIYLTIVLVMVILVTGIFGFYQESANNSIMESFKKMIPKFANVIRDGVEKMVPTEELVLGDLVQFQLGDCVPADIRLIYTEALKVDNSSITGESEPQYRNPDSVDKNPLESSNLIFYGTNVVEGNGRGIVISCGDDTLMGHIAGLTSGLQAADTLIKKELNEFVHIITGMAVVIGIIFFAASMSIGYNFFEAFVYCIAIIVANVPEGLLVTMTACLTLTARKMAKKNCLVKNLQAIETLGSTTVICSDKTGTLTQNRMTLSHMCFDLKTHDVLMEEPNFDMKSTGFMTLCRVGILCNKAQFLADQEDVPIHNRKVLGDASETGVLKAMETFVGNVEEYRNTYPKVFEVPFNSTNKYQLSIHSYGSKYFIVMKGAPEKIIDRCDTVYQHGSEIPMGELVKSQIKKQILNLGFLGERVLGFADYNLPSSFGSGYRFSLEHNKANFPERGLRFVGLMSMIDPPRPGVPEAVAKCKSAGIRVIMVTGDHPITAISIARKVGIISPDNETVYDIAMRRNISASKVGKEDITLCKATVITGSELRDMTSEELDYITSSYQEIVFARTSPQQKLLIVESFQRNSEIVAVTGDGVNDSPALKKADIGIAMGISGSDVSKEAADMIILDDNFASIVIGIEEGRLIFDNLKKSIAYMLTSNLPEICPFVMFVIISIPPALSIMAILIIDVGTDLWPGISLAYEKAEADIMKRMPRDSKQDKLVNARLICFTYLNIGVLQSCAGFTSFFFTMAMHGFMPDDLIGIRSRWEMHSINDLKDYYGREWSYRERKILERKCFAAYFLAIVVTQIADVYICKTRRLSVFNQRNNWVMNTGVLFEIAIAFFVVYCPVLNSVLQFEAVDLICVLPSIPFAVIIFVFDELRRAILRKHPTGWVKRETYF